MYSTNAQLGELWPVCGTRLLLAKRDGNAVHRPGVTYLRAVHAAGAGGEALRGRHERPVSLQRCPKRVSDGRPGSRRGQTPATFISGLCHGSDGCQRRCHIFGVASAQDAGLWPASQTGRPCAASWHLSELCPVRRGVRRAWWLARSRAALDLVLRQVPACSRPGGDVPMTYTLVRGTVGF